MAYFVNNKNVDSYIFSQNDEILVINTNNCGKEIKLCSTKLKCVPQGTKEGSGNENGKKKGKSDNEQIKVSSSSISNCGNFVVACDSNNSVHLWKRKEDIWEILSTRYSVRKCQKVIFLNSSTDILLADRGGDVFSFSVSECHKEGKFILGHICFITDISISSNDKYLTTCDRDGKIRISCFPNCYNIVSYCLGHNEFVSTVQFITLNQELLISSSGDGTLRLWDYKNGGEKLCEKMYENNKLCNFDKTDAIFENNSITDSNNSLPPNCSNVIGVKFSVQCLKVWHRHNLLVVLYHFLNGLAIYKISDNKFSFIQFLSLPNPALNTIFSENDLVALVKQSSNPLYFFKYIEETGSFQTFSEEQSSNLTLELKAFYGDFQAVINSLKDEQMLFKKCFESNDDEEECKTKRNKVS